MSSRRSGAEPAATVLFGADEPVMVARVLAALRIHLGRELGLIDESRDEFLWVTDFPLFEWDEDERALDAQSTTRSRHRPATRTLIENDPGAALTSLRPRLNGSELGWRLVPDPRPRAPEARLRQPGDRRGAAEEFGFLLEALRWARRRTAGSRGDRATLDGPRAASRTSATRSRSRRPGRRRPDDGRADADREGVLAELGIQERARTKRACGTPTQPAYLAESEVESGGEVAHGTRRPRASVTGTVADAAAAHRGPAAAPPTATTARR